MRKIIYILVCVLCIGLQSCTDGIDLRDGSERSQLVLEAFICSDTDQSEAHLSTSVIINSQNQRFEFPTDAIITIRDLDNANSAVYDYDNVRKLYVVKDFEIIPGNTYEIIANWPNSDYQEIHGVTQVPAKTEIEEIEELSNTTVEMESPEVSKKVLDYQIKISEPLSYPAFYRLDVWRKDLRLDGENQVFWFENKLVHLENFKILNGGNAVHELEQMDGILIDASKLENNTFSISLESDELTDGVNVFEDLMFGLQTIDSEFYNYHLTTSRELKAAGTSFNQPVVSYTNIVNGFGFFGSMSESIDSVSVE